MNYIFLSTDNGAPLLTGENGTLVNLLDKCLVDGYGSVAITGIVRSGSTVTVTTSSPHGFQDWATILIAGADQADYNGRFRVATVPSSTTLSFDIGMATPLSPATGTMSVKRAPIGWSKAFSATNKASYRLPAGSNQHYLDVDDNNVDSSRSALLRGYRSMTAVGTGTEPFPTTVQAANCYWRKSNATGSSTRAWAIFADDHCFYLATFWHTTHSDAAELFSFGQDIAWNGADAYMTRISYAVNSASTATSGPHTAAGSPLYSRQASSPNSYLAADIGGTPNAPQQGAFDSFATALFGSESVNNLAVPGTITGDQIICPAYACTAESNHLRQVRGRLPGWHPGLYAQATIPSFAIRNDFLEYPGKRFMALRTGGAVINARNAHYFDVDGPWR